MIQESLIEISTILDLLRWTNSQFSAAKIYCGHGTNNFWDETLHLILPSLGLPIYVSKNIYHSNLTKQEKLHAITLVKQRTQKKIPVPYLTNQAWFCGLKFYVDQRVFIPRSPIGELISKCFDKLILYTPHRILDMCTGSGAIAIAVAIAYPTSKVDAVDISVDALKIAQHNIKLYNLENRINIIYSNLFYNLPISKYDLIITNPPYIKKSNITKLPKEFHFEPSLSLSAGNNSLKIIKKILVNTINYLSKKGILICEVGSSQSPLMHLYPHIPFNWLKFTNGGKGVFILTYKQLLNLNNKI